MGLELVFASFCPFIETVLYFMDCFHGDVRVSCSSFSYQQITECVISGSQSGISVAFNMIRTWRISHPEISVQNTKQKHRNSVQNSTQKQCAEFHTETNNVPNSTQKQKALQNFIQKQCGEFHTETQKLSVQNSTQKHKKVCRIVVT